MSTRNQAAWTETGTGAGQGLSPSIVHVLTMATTRSGELALGGALLTWSGGRTAPVHLGS